MPLAYTLEKRVAISAVLRACQLTSAVFNTLVKGETLTKGDKSPVTIADFSAQAVVNAILTKVFPNDPIIGEEDSADLRAPTPEATQLRERIHKLANDAIRAPLLPMDKADWAIGPDQPIRDEAAILELIDKGNYEGGPTGRMWTLDPIDGTKGFLRGEQYAVCLALIVDSEVQVAVMGCPNLPARDSLAQGSDSESDGEGEVEPEKGALFVAVRGQGSEEYRIASPRTSTLLHLNTLPKSPFVTGGGFQSQQRSFQSSFPSTPITPHSPNPPTSHLRVLESVEAAHGSHPLNDRVSELLGLTRPAIRMDSQAKYCSLARGVGDIYLRLPAGKGEYKEKIWDHAPGSLLLTEAGALVTNLDGQPLNFGLGRTLGENRGVIAAAEEVHGAVLKAVQQAWEEARESRL